MKKTAMTIIIGLCSLAISTLVVGQDSQDPVTIGPGQSVTVSCDGNTEPQPSPHEDHFSWHFTVAKKNGLDSCRKCHGADLRGTNSTTAHGIRVFPTKDGVIDAVGCYPNPWLAIGRPDPFGETGQSICNATGLKQAVYQAGTKVGCYQCHKQVMGVTLR